MLRRIILLLLLGATAAENPLRKIITLLQNLRKEVEVEGKKRKELYDAFMCYCDTNIMKTQKNLDQETAHAASLKSTIEELSGSNEQLKAEIKELSEDLAEDSKAAEEATKVRKSEAAQFATDSVSMKEAIQALDKAIPALRAGLKAKEAAALLQSLSGPLLHGAQLTGQREEILSLLQGEQPSGGSAEILGVITQMRASFKENLENAVKEEEDAINTFDNLMGGKNKEITAAKKELEAKEGQVAAQVQAKADAEEDLDDTKVQIEQDEKFLLGLKKECAAKTKEQEHAEKTQMEEMGAIQETIKILNDDDALEMFKKTVPSPSLIQGYTQVSFLQTKMTTRSRMAMRMRQQAMDELQRVYGDSPPSGNAALLMSRMRRVQQPDQFAELKGMINNMIADLQTEQKDDEKHKEWCTKEFDLTEDEQKKIQDTLETHTQKLEAMNNDLANILDEIETLKKEVADLDVAMKTATAQRKKEKSLTTETLSEYTISLSILKKAKDKLASFYVKKAAFVQVQEGQQDQGLSREEQMFGLGAADASQNTAPYEKKTGAAAGILGMLDTIRQDLKLGQQELEMEEKNAQAAYDKTMTESKESMEAKKKDIIVKGAQSSRIQEEMAFEKKGKGMAEDELETVKNKMKGLHESCDFLLENFDIRKKARASEIEGLQKSIAVLSGANFGSDLQVDASQSAPPAFLQVRQQASRA